MSNVGRGGNTPNPQSQQGQNPGQANPYTGYTQNPYAQGGYGVPQSGMSNQSGVPYGTYAQSPYGQQGMQTPYTGNYGYTQGASPYMQGANGMQNGMQPGIPQRGMPNQSGMQPGVQNGIPQSGIPSPNSPYTSSAPNPYANPYSGGVPNQNGAGNPYTQGNPYQAYNGMQGNPYTGYGVQNPYAPTQVGGQGGMNGQQGYQGYYQGGPTQKPAPVPAPQPKQKKQLPIEPDLLFVFISAIVLVLLFILSLTLGIPAVKWVFLACAVVFVGAIWVRPILETGPKTTATVLCAVAALVVALSMFLVSNADRTNEGDDQTAGSAPTAAPASESEDDLGTQALMEEGLGTWEDTDVIQANLVTPTPDTNSATLESLSSFLFFWTINDYDSMVNYCAPSWVKSQEDSRVALFGILANRLLKSYTPGTPTGTDNDISRTVPVTAIVDKNTNDGESIFIFNIIMLKENDAWYVDPQSLKSHEEVEATTFSVIITQPPTPQPAESSMVLYYNTDGGSYYHADPYCEAVAEKYRPLTGTFTYGQINEPAYAKLKVCQRCAAPMRPSN